MQLSHGKVKNFAYLGCCDAAMFYDRWWSTAFAKRTRQSVILMQNRYRHPPSPGLRQTPTTYECETALQYGQPW